MFSFFKSWRGRSRDLDGYFTRYLTAHYNMTPEELSKLKFTTDTDRIASRDVTMFRVYDPERTTTSVDKITYKLLDDYPEAIMFQGRFAANNTVTEIKDLRSPA